MSNKKILSGINTVLIVNIVNLILNAITNLLLPKYLSIDTYAVIKEYQMYVSYAGILHFGFLEGLYIKYGGVDYSSINKKSLREEICNLLFFQLIIVVLGAAISLLLQQLVILLAVITAFPINMAGAYKLLFQASGEFKSYGQIMNATSVLMLVCNIALIFLLKQNAPYIYIICYLGVHTIIWLALEYHNKNIVHFERIISIVEFGIIRNNIRAGFLLMLGNFASIIQTTMDRLFVKSFLNSKDFAFYSFAVTMDSMLNVLITPITVTMYNYFCKDKRRNDYGNVIRYVMGVSSFLISLSFILNTFISFYIPDYSSTKTIINLLFLTQFVYVLIKGIYINMYKAKEMQRIYFIKLMISIFSGFVLNYALYFLINNKEAFALATFFSSLIWLSLCTFDFRSIGLKTPDWVFWIIEILLYLGLNALFESIVGFMLFVMITYCNSVLLLRINWLKEVWILLKRGKSEKD